MNVFSMRTMSGVCALAAIWLAATAAAAQTATSRIVNAANAFFRRSTRSNGKVCCFAFNDEKQRANWSNLADDVRSPDGISLKDLNAAQRSAAMLLVSSALSPRGFEKIEQIMEAIRC